MYCICCLVCRRCLLDKLAFACLLEYLSWLLCCLEYPLRHVCFVVSVVGLVDIASWIKLSWSPVVQSIRFIMSASMYEIYH